MRLKRLKEHLKTQLPYKRTQRVGEQIHKILSDIAIKYIDLSSFSFRFTFRFTFIIFTIKYINIYNRNIITY